MPIIYHDHLMLQPRLTFGEICFDNASIYTINSTNHIDQLHLSTYKTITHIQTLILISLPIIN